MHGEGNTGLRVAQVGLCVNPSLPHLGACLLCLNVSQSQSMRAQKGPADPEVDVIT